MPEGFFKKFLLQNVSFFADMKNGCIFATVNQTKRVYSSSLSILKKQVREDKQIILSNYD